MIFNYLVEWVSLVINSLFAGLALWGVYCFWPTNAQRPRRLRTLLRLSSMRKLGPTYTLMVAIWVGFLGVFLNVLYWRVFGDVALYYEWITVESLIHYGVYGDLIWKTLGAVAILMHFYARWLSIPEEDQPDWPILFVAYYPDREHWLYRIANRHKPSEKDHDNIEK